LLGHSKDIKTNSDTGGIQCTEIAFKIGCYFTEGGHRYWMRQNLFVDRCYRTDR